MPASPASHLRKRTQHLVSVAGSQADERKAEAGLVTGDAHELLEGVVAVELHHQLLLQVLAEPIHKHVHLPTRDNKG